MLEEEKMIESCTYMHPEGFCEFEGGKCKYLSESLECLATEKDLITICPECDLSEDECKCWS